MGSESSSPSSLAWLLFYSRWNGFGLDAKNLPYWYLLDLFYFYFNPTFSNLQAIDKKNTNTIQYQDLLNKKIRDKENQDKGLYWFNSQENLHQFSLRTLRTITIKKSLYKYYAEANLYHKHYSLKKIIELINQEEGELVSKSNPT